jgi:membrane-bound lytic murein transglycosylase MltF
MIVAAVLASSAPAQAADDYQARYRGCRTRECDARVLRRKRQRAWARRHPWQYRFNRLAAWERSWVRSTAWCESHNNPRTSTGNGYYGLLQFSWPTAQAAGFRTYPHLTSWHEQAVRGVWWMRRAGRGQWPVCGR